MIFSTNCVRFILFLVLLLVLPQSGTCSEDQIYDSAAFDECVKKSDASAVIKEQSLSNGKTKGTSGRAAIDPTSCATSEVCEGIAGTCVACAEKFRNLRLRKRSSSRSSSSNFSMMPSVVIGCVGLFVVKYLM